MAKMLIETRNDQDQVYLREQKTDALVSTDPKEIVRFLKGNTTTAGFSIQFAVNPTTKQVVEIFKKGKLIQRDVKPLIDAGFNEFHFSWAFAGKNWKLDDGTVVQAKTLDLVKMKDVLPYAALLGY